MLPYPRCANQPKANLGEMGAAPAAQAASLQWANRKLLGQILNFLFADDSETLCVTQFQVTDVWTISLSLLASVE